MNAYIMLAVMNYLMCSNSLWIYGSELNGESLEMEPLKLNLYYLNSFIYVYVTGYVACAYK